MRIDARSSITTAFVVLLAGQPAWGAPSPSPTVADILQGVTGEWTGALAYRDYQTNRLFELPVRTTIQTVGDGVTQVRIARFDEGPGRSPAWITSVSSLAADGTLLTTAFFRAGQPVEVQSETVSLRAYNSPTSWTIVYSQTGSDGDKPAEIRVTETRDGQSLLSVKEVRAVGPSSQSWKFRNQTRLTKMEKR